jgi:site-specific DNA-methyltransferase (adenine-specific)
VSTPLFELSNLDAVAWLRALPAASVDLLITIQLRIAREASRGWNDDAAEAQQGVEQRLVHRVPERAFRGAVRRGVPRAPRRHALLSVLRRGNDVHAKPEAEKAGFRFWKPLVWDKQTIGMGYHYRARYEFILFFEKGKRRLNDLGVADIINVPRVHRGYPAEKPGKCPKSSSSKARAQERSWPIRSWARERRARPRLRNRPPFFGTDLNGTAVQLTRERLQKFGEGRAPDLGQVSPADLAEPDGH